MWTLEVSWHWKLRPSEVDITSLMSPAWAADPCETAGRQRVRARGATGGSPMQQPPRDFAVTSHPTQLGCRKIDPLPPGWRIRDAVLSRTPEVRQSVSQFATVASGEPGAQCNDLIPNDCRCT